MELSAIPTILYVFDQFIWGIPVLLIVILLPLTIYDQKKGEYKGFLSPLAILWLVSSAATGWRFMVISESSRLEPWEYAVVSAVFAVAAARIMVEAMHRRIYGEWLHKHGVWLLKKPAKTE